MDDRCAKIATREKLFFNKSALTRLASHLDFSSPPLLSFSSFLSLYFFFFLLSSCFFFIPPCLWLQKNNIILFYIPAKMFLAFPLPSRTNVPFFNTRFPHFPLFSAIFSSLAETVIGKVRVFQADKWFLVFRGRHECPPFCFYLLLLPCLSRMTFYERVLGSFLFFSSPPPFLFSPLIRTMWICQKAISLLFYIRYFIFSHCTTSSFLQLFTVFCLVREILEIMILI